MSWSSWQNYDLVAAPGRPVTNPGPQRFQGSPVAVARSADFFNVYARGMDNRLLQFQWSRSAGYTWWVAHTDGGVLASAPGAGARNPDHEVVAVRGTDNRLWTKEWTASGSWTTWQQRGGSRTFVDSPTVICRNNDAINVYARDERNRLIQIFWTRDRGWLPDWQVHEDGALITAAPAVVSLGGDHEALFVRGTDNRLWWKEWHRDRGWSRFTQIGGSTTFRDNPTAVSRNRDVINVYARGDDDAVLQLSWRRDRGWDSAWQRHGDGGRVRAGLAAIRVNDESEIVFAHGTDDRLWSKWWHRDGVLRLPLHFKYVDDPDRFQFTTAEVEAATRLVFAGAFVSAELRSVERISDSTLLDINAGACEDWWIFTTFNRGQEALFANRNNAGPDDIVVYFVRSASGFNGCAVHPGDRPGCIVARPATLWTVAHEVGHVLGRGHDGSTDHLMFRSTSRITNLPPNLSIDQVGAGRHVRRG